MAWLYLTIAGIFEVVWATFMKMSNGFHKLNFTILTIIGMIISFVCLAEATRRLPMSLAYPIWTGIGAVGSIIVGVIFFRGSHQSDHLGVCRLFTDRDHRHQIHQPLKKMATSCFQEGCHFQLGDDQ